MEGKYADAVRVLQLELQNFPRSRAALSLLGFCYYYLQVRMCVCMWGVTNAPCSSLIP